MFHSTFASRRPDLENRASAIECCHTTRTAAAPGTASAALAVGQGASASARSWRVRASLAGHAIGALIPLQAEHAPYLGELPSGLTLKFQQRIEVHGLRALGGGRQPLGCDREPSFVGAVEGFERGLHEGQPAGGAGPSWNDSQPDCLGTIAQVLRNGDNGGFRWFGHLVQLLCLGVRPV